MGQDEVDVQLLQGSGELSGVAPAPELLCEALGLLGRALEDAVPVAVESQGDAVALDDVPEASAGSPGRPPLA